jgi:hypothetical protein
MKGANGSKKGANQGFGDASVDRRGGEELSSMRTVR